MTVHSSGKVNLNTAPREVLMSLSAGADAADAGAIDGATADAIIAYRKEHPFTATDQIGNVSPFLRELYRRTRIRDIVDVRSTAFRVRATGEFGDTSRTVDAVGIRSGIEYNGVSGAWSRSVTDTPEGTNASVCPTLPARVRRRARTL